MALRKLVAGNWKMNGSFAALAELEAIAVAAHDGVDVAVCLPFTLIAVAVAQRPGLAIGAQDCHWDVSGAHTGCVSVSMLKESQASLVIVGHSERRTDNHEGDAEVKAKAEAAISGGLTAIVCVGETEAERDAGQAVSVVEGQIAGSLPSNGSAEMLAIAYEPVWAIGTGRTPSLDDVSEMHDAIRTKLIALMGQAGTGVRILYGGSVKPSNAAELMSVANVDGALVGGASLKANDFLPIIDAAR
jgi:triosephosphate isomerase (TIM)